VNYSHGEDITSQLPTGKLTVRPWQASGLEYDGNHSKLVIFWVYEMAA
jgi:hypothetical protein